MLVVDQDTAGERMRIAILDDVHHAYEGTTGVSRLRDRAEVQIFTGPFGDPAVLRSFDAIVANRERTRFTRDLFATTSKSQNHRTDGKSRVSHRLSCR
jgi:hypothetical protein